MTNKAAVDEGRNPYGRPGKGNHHDAWFILQDTPCTVCGSKEKRMIIEGDLITIMCVGEAFVAKARD